MALTITACDDDNSTSAPKQKTVSAKSELGWSDFENEVILVEDEDNEYKCHEDSWDKLNGSKPTFSAKEEKSSFSAKSTSSAKEVAELSESDFGALWSGQYNLSYTDKNSAIFWLSDRGSDGEFGPISESSIKYNTGNRKERMRSLRCVMD